MYKTLLREIEALSAKGSVPDSKLRARLETLVIATQKRKPPSRASLVREGLIDGIRPVRSLLTTIAKLPWQATGEHLSIKSIAKLQAFYLKGFRKLPDDVVASFLEGFGMAALDRRIGEVQLPEVILAVDTQVRFSWIMLELEARSTDELLIVYAGIVVRGTSLTTIECAGTIPQLSATNIRQAMRGVRDERRLSQACQAVLAFMQRHRISAT